MKTYLIGFNDNDETIFSAETMEELDELLDVFFEENGIEDPVIDYIEETEDKE